MNKKHFRQLFQRYKQQLLQLDIRYGRTRKFLVQWTSKARWIRDWSTLPLDTISFIETYAKIYQDAWVMVEEGFEKTIGLPVAINEVANNWWFEKHAHIRRDPAGVATLHHGIVYGHNGGQYLTSDRYYLADLGREHFKYFDTAWIHQQLRLRKPKHIPGCVAVIADQDAYRNFSHWIYDVLPKVSLIERTVGLDAIDVFLVGHSNLSFQRDTLERLGVHSDKVVRFTADCAYTADRLVFPRLAGYNRTYQPKWVIDWLRDKFDQSKVSSFEKIFVSRAKDSFRYLSGEATLVEQLKVYGYKAITLNGVSLDDTIRLFTRCKSLIGCFGSGLMNVAFCADDAECFEIAGTKFYSPYHWYLAEERGIRHYTYFGDEQRFPVKGPVMDTKADVVIECDDFLRFFQQHSKVI